MKDKKILICITGGIAIYKVCSLVRLFVRNDAQVKVVMTKSATKLISPLVFQSLTGFPVYTDLFKPVNENGLEHISLNDWCDVCILAPATANTIGKIANGIADNLLTTTVMALSGNKSIIVAPAMNTNMWENSIVKKNMEVLNNLENYYIVEPEIGRLATKQENEGKGRLANIQKIFEASKKALSLEIMSSEYDLREFLQETRYCDCNNSKIQKIAHELTRSCFSEREKAMALFQYVRDNILYKFGYWGKKSSTTLEEGSGMCTNSANLLIALLRAVGIPSAYGVMRVDTREYFGPIMLPMFKNLISKNSVHIYSYVYLNNRWIKCDPSIDKHLSEKTSYFNPASELVAWDGLNDKIDNISPKYVYMDSGPYSSIDEMLDRKPKYARKNTVKAGNLYLDFLRQNEIKIQNTEELEPMFLSWLKRNSAVFYMSFLPIIKIKSLGRKIS